MKVCVGHQVQVCEQNVLVESADAESVPSGLELAVEIRNLDKVYSNNTKAVLSTNAFPCTALI